MRSPFRLADGPMLPQVPNPAFRRLRRMALRLAALACLGAMIIALHKPALIGFAYLFRVDNPAPSDALVVLLGGPGHRPLRAAQLYHQGIAPLVLLSHGATDDELGVSEEQIDSQLLIRHGVPDNAIHILYPIVSSTRDEALRVLDYAHAHPSVKRITIVTTSFHTGRSRWIFRRVFRGSGIDIRAAAADQPEFNESNWYTKDEGLVFYFGEAIKSIFYRLVY